MWDETFRSVKAVILERWRELIANTYPEQSAKFLRREQNEFRNPVGAAILRESETLFDALCGDGEDAGSMAAVENLARIRAVQEFDAGEAVNFVFLLKTATRESLAGRLEEPGMIHGMLEFESRIDRLALAAFTAYQACREKIFEIRVNNLNRQVYKMLERIDAGPAKWRAGDNPSGRPGGCSC